MPTYFLTGANRGLGLEFVRQLASSPSNTIIAGIRDPSTDHASLSSFNTHKNVHIIQVDASSASSLSSVASSVSEILGDKPLDFLFNVAGINATSADTSLDLTSESLMQHMQTNVYAPARIVQELKGKLSKGAVVMNVTSGLGSLKIAGEFTKCCTYSMSKAALSKFFFFSSSCFHLKWVGKGER
jgi:NAD(P)-dependent dehydrogenase (short-subunit alcohol dehydrogenase family)